MNHMKRASVTRNKVIAKLVPVAADTEPVSAALKPPAETPDFMARLKNIYGDRIFEPSNAELIAEERDRF
jgi:hypothetical protein